MRLVDSDRMGKAPEESVTPQDLRVAVALRGVGRPHHSRPECVAEELVAGADSLGADSLNHKNFVNPISLSLHSTRLDSPRLASPRRRPEGDRRVNKLLKQTKEVRRLGAREKIVCTLGGIRQSDYHLLPRRQALSGRVRPRDSKARKSRGRDTDE